MSHSNCLTKLQESLVKQMEEKQKKAEQALQELRDLLDAGRKQQDEAIRRKEAELREAMDIPKEYWLPPETSLREVMENVKRQISLTEQTLSQRQNLTDRELVRWASGGLALQGIYKTSSQKDLLEQREQLLSVPEEFTFFGPEQGTQMETKEFASSEAESNFTQTIGKLGFTISTLDKGNGWGINLEAKDNHSKHSESMEIKKSCSYFCSTKFMYVPLVSCHFSIDQLQLSEDALQELKRIEELLDARGNPNRIVTVRSRTGEFFQRFGSHANRGPLHLGGIYWWKATSQGFQTEQLEKVKQQSTEMLDAYIRGSYSDISLTVAAGVGVSSSHSNTASSNFQNKVQLSMVHTGGPKEANSPIQWKAGLIASNRTWCVIGRGQQLVSIWDIIFTNHRSDFKDPLRVANSLVESYNYLTRLNAQKKEGEEFLGAQMGARDFLETMKSWEVSNPMQQLKQLIYGSQLGKFQWRNLHSMIPTMKNFFQKIPIKMRFSPTESVVEDINVTQFCKLIQKLKEVKSHLMEVQVNSQNLEVMKEAQRQATYEVSKSLCGFLSYLQEIQQVDTELLLLSIAAGAGYSMTNNTFQCLLGREELNYLLHEMQTAHDKHQELQNICRYRAQAFLVLTGLTATLRHTAVSPEEKTRRLALIKEYIGHSLTREVAHILNKMVTNDWENLEKDLKLLINGENVATEYSMLMGIVKNELQRLLHEKNSFNELCEPDKYMSEVQENRTLLELLHCLGLKDKFPKKMMKAEFHLIHKISVHNNKSTNEQELPFYFLQKLLTLNYGLRCLDSNNGQEIDNLLSPDRFSEDNQTFDPFEDNFEEKEDAIPATNTRLCIHPMDIQMAILHCADDFARQYIMGKLSTCQFALPLLVPNPCNSKIAYYLWSFSQIRRTWQQKNKSRNENHYFNNQQMCRVPTPIVSFIRVGNGLTASKSQIMNCLLSKRKHDFFFHRHCKGSSKDCLLMEGVVEICWFCPAGEEDDRFDNCLTFANLHGNAKEYPQQLKFLQEVSSVLVILMATTDDNEENRNYVRQLCQSPKPFILLLDDKENAMANKFSHKVKIGIKNRNETELIEGLTTTIKKLLKLCGADTYSLEDCANVARKHGFLVDEDQRECKEAKEKAEIIIARLKEIDIAQAKKTLLPLQGQLWQQWCKNDKELYHLKEKGNRSIEQHKSEIETEKQKIRQQQLERAFPLNDLMQSFLRSLLTESETHRKLFLQWLTVLLDNLTSENLEKLNEKKMTLWSMIQSKNNGEQSDLKKLESKIESVSKEINSCSLGIDHFFREIGQIYEAVDEIYPDKDLRELCLFLPQIAADLMISGFAIELMDGDASYIPLKWVIAVLDQVSEKLGDKKLFILSVLGIQSSGKSTLLNALFGLQFTVGVGRCTRGAYMQLLKVEETLTEELGFDFLLVVDTEGLRAPELSNKSQIHDNELATFVIGLANLTLINIFGENPSEMQDILQIVIQAFLRMKQVKISPSCLFVHQNVEEVTAKFQTMEGRRKLMQRLDEMTAAAAEQEQYSNITCFNDVIKFDANSQVHYFAHLWDGNPPMAPPNPRYSHNIQELKIQILETAKQSKESIMKISDAKMRIQDLWRALVCENFIFSFRNTQEVLAMSKLEAMYNHWSWELRSHILSLQNKLMNQIQNGKLQTLEKTKLVTPVTAKYDAIKQELEQYFNEDPDSEILIQWKANFQNRIRILKDTLISETQTKLTEMIDFKKNQEMLDHKKSYYEKEVVKRSQELALTVKGRGLSNEELHQKFDQLWEKWVLEVKSNYIPDEESNVVVDAESILLKHFNQENNIGEKINKIYWKGFQINYDEHIQIKRMLNDSNNKICLNEKISINMITDHIISKVNEKIDFYRKQQLGYNKSYFHNILKIMEEEVKLQSSKEKYNFTNKYKIDLSLSLFKDASEKFKVMHREFKEANDPVNYLENKKNEFFMSFKMSCEGSFSVKTFVDYLWQKLTPAIYNTVCRKMVLKMSADLQTTCSEFSGNRSNLEKHILIYLAEEENFGKYLEYIQEPQPFFNSYIETQVKKYYSGKGSERIKSFLRITLDDTKNTILSAIRLSTNTPDVDGTMTASTWLDLFCDYLGNELIFPRKDLISIEHQEIKDIDFLKEVMSEGLDPTMNTMKEKHLTMSMEEMIPEITKILSEHLCGCWAQCPFCCAICTNTIPGHDGDHSVPFHRPEALSGRRWHETDHFATDFCTTAVASDCAFSVENGKYFPYKIYRQAGGEYATWSITPDSSTQPYWKWFVCHFRSQLEENYHLKFEGMGQIPKSWFKISKQDVLDDLKK